MKIISMAVVALIFAVWMTIHLLRH
jgi:hypothetical protein